MGKAKTSQKQKTSSKNKLPEFAQLKAGVKTYPHDPSESLRDKDGVMLALTQALVDGDEEAFRDILRGYYQAMGVEKALEKTKLPRRTYFDALSERGNPRLSTIVQLMHGLKF